ncbi:MAG: hypothetical protein ACYCQJ_03265 [Nitrososphaerales archaeon]
MSRKKQLTNPKRIKVQQGPLDYDLKLALQAISKVQAQSPKKDLALLDQKLD